jgi:hypothetical protein
MGVQRDDITSSYKDFVNEAIFEIEKMRDWSDSHTLGTLNWPQGQSIMRMPEDFKAFGEIPAAFVLDNTQNPPCQWPCRIVHRSAFYNSGLRAGPYWASNPNSGVGQFGGVTPRAEFPLWYDYIDGMGVLGTIGPVGQNMQFSVSYYRHQAPLNNPTDSNPFTLKEPLLVIARAKAVAFSSINDPLAMACLQEVDYLFNLARVRDERIRLAGVTLRMRG